MMDAGEVTKADVKWLHRFAKSVALKTDPVSRYERKATHYAIWRKFRAALIGAIIAVAGVAAYYLINFLSTLQF